VPKPSDHARWVGIGICVAVLGCAFALVGSFAGQPWPIVGVGTFLVGSVMAGVAAVKAGFHFGRGR